MVVFLIVVAVLLVVYLVMRWYNPYLLYKFTRRKNTITFGKIGTGKDLVFSLLTHWDKVHAANIPYNPNTMLEPLQYVTVAPNTYSEFVDGNVQVVGKTLREGVNYYISDGGIYLPSQMDTALSKSYPSLPIAYALIRHLANANIHVNVQNLNRLWIKLREQADGYIRTRGATFFPRWLPFLRHYFLLKVTLYENYDDALDCLRPIRKVLNGDSAAVARSERGLVKEMRILWPRKHLQYDTRYFHSVIYGVPAPQKESRRERKPRKAPK